MKFSEIIASEKPVLVDFFAEWCGPCKMMAPILTQVKNELAEDVKIVKIDVDKNQQLSALQKVQSVPTLMLFKNGKLLWRKSGVPTKQELVSLVRANA